ncbi:MAG: NDP-sugar synthase [Byssovorax sp.]
MTDPPFAMILAAGFGTRLRPLTDELPKPLVPVGDRAAVAHIADRLAKAGIHDAVVNTHHLAEAFTPQRIASLPVRLRVIHEPTILGTAGGITHAAGLLGDGDVLVWNGDILVDFDLEELLEQHRSARAVATMAVAPRALGEGTVGIDVGGAIVRLRGERFGDEARGGDFLGITALGPVLRARLPREGCLIGDGCLPALRAGERVASITTTTEWDDIGSIATYARANTRWLDRHRIRNFVGPGASIDPGVVLEGCVVGAGAQVRGRGTMRGAVIWPGARVEAPLEQVVVTTAGVVARG